MIDHMSIILSNPLRPDLAPFECTGFIDRAAVHLSVPLHVAHQLGLCMAGQREVRLAGGSRQLVHYVGPLSMDVANRRCFAGAVVLGDHVRLGTIPMSAVEHLPRL